MAELLLSKQHATHVAEPEAGSDRTYISGPPLHQTRPVCVFGANADPPPLSCLPARRRTLCGPGVTYAELDAEAAAVAPGAEGLLAQDHFQVSGRGGGREQHGRPGVCVLWTGWWCLPACMHA